ncbi:MAG: hypothetical protein CME63_00570 [Halobacteriovoraceae bacterium]|nr:hypothetical protein [Halobacteriovoraceae bacterium]MBC96218.1 hypothetical protein [Halobacteriovoraceae bacterium]|tara:strand:+ start:107870 stop:108358 length:489 start_codon:yes stop_codon:yes gene_type:complete
MKLLKNIILFTFVGLFLSDSVSAQNLLQERIRRISSRKRSIYLDTGIFHNGGPKINSKLKAVRHSFSPKRGYERVVFDFTTKELPRVYGYISRDENKLFLDLFETDVPASLTSFGDSKFVKELLFFPIQKDTLSVEVIFKSNVTLDVFYLSNPGRLVIDIKK